MRILAASWVLPVSGPPILDGAVGVEDGRIAWVGPRLEAPVGSLTNLGPGVLLPGLINAHCHLELSHLHALSAEERDFVPWVAALVTQRAAAEPRAAERALQEAIAWLEHETATAGVADVSNTLASVRPLAASTLRAVVFHELFGWDPARCDEVLRSAEELRVAVGASRVDVRPAAHAPHSVSPALFAALRKQGGPAALHLAESPAETEFLRTGTGEWPELLRSRGLVDVRFAPAGVNPVQYVARLGVLHEGLLAAHAVQVDEADIATLARHRVAVVVCPRSNRTLRVGVAPVPRLLAGGVSVCLGTDSLASSPDLDVAREMVTLRQQFPDLSGRAIVQMATAAGARALGFSDLGTLEVGKSAQFAFAAAPSVPPDPEEWVLSGEAALKRVAA
jgi:cytosine/adenosine deaminase-related metal-dependent hydrolase